VYAYRVCQRIKNAARHVARAPQKSKRAAPLRPLLAPACRLGAAKKKTSAFVSMKPAVTHHPAGRQLPHHLMRAKPQRWLFSLWRLSLLLSGGLLAD
jgi:hypothetical protein